MALPNNRSLTEQALPVYLPDLSTANTVYVASPFRGSLSRVYSCIENAITSADADWTVSINGTDVTGLTATVTQSGSAAGDVDIAYPTGSNHYVNEGDYIGIATDGGSSTTCPTQFTVVIERD